MTVQTNQTSILLVEDDQSQAELMKMGISAAGGGCEIAHVADGAEAIAYLRRTGEYADAARPRVVLLDLNLPKLSGLEVLECVKTDPDLLEIPIVILSTSDDTEDRAKAYEHKANSYVMKPVGFDKFQQMCRDLRHYWTELNQSPS